MILLTGKGVWFYCIHCRVLPQVKVDRVYDSLAAADAAHDYMLTNANNGKIVVVVSKGSKPEL